MYCQSVSQQGTQQILDGGVAPVIPSQCMILSTRTTLGVSWHRPVRVPIRMNIGLDLSKPEDEGVPVFQSVER